MTITKQVTGVAAALFYLVSGSPIPGVSSNIAQAEEDDSWVGMKPKTADGSLVTSELDYLKVNTVDQGITIDSQTLEFGYKDGTVHTYKVNSNLFFRQAGSAATNVLEVMVREGHPQEDGKKYTVRVDDEHITGTKDYKPEFTHLNKSGENKLFVEAGMDCLADILTDSKSQTIVCEGHLVYPPVEEKDDDTPSTPTAASVQNDYRSDMTETRMPKAEVRAGMTQQRNVREIPGGSNEKSGIDFYDLTAGVHAVEKKKGSVGVTVNVRQGHGPGDLGPDTVSVTGDLSIGDGIGGKSPIDILGLPVNVLAQAGVKHDYDPNDNTNTVSITFAEKVVLPVGQYFGLAQTGEGILYQIAPLSREGETSEVGGKLGLYLRIPGVAHAVLAGTFESSDYKVVGEGQGGEQKGGYEVQLSSEALVDFTVSYFQNLYVHEQSATMDTGGPGYVLNPTEHHNGGGQGFKAHLLVPLTDKVGVGVEGSWSKQKVHDQGQENKTGSVLFKYFFD
ncbi:hypothetical protein ACFL0W_06120 [Nanoarchaeota archaeon]